MDEEWRDIEGYEGLYQVSNEGRVKSVRRNLILKPRDNNRGYLMVDLYNEGRMKHGQIHRLVANAFIENPNNLPQVNHKDEDKTNNMVENLEWCDASYNNNYGSRNQRASNTQRNNLKRSKTVYQYSHDGELVNVYPSARECGRQGFNQAHVSNCCNGGYFSKQSGKWVNSNMYKGYRWSYEPLDEKMLEGIATS